MEKITPGRYMHFRGNEYEVLGIAKHSETLEDFVVYKACYNSQELNNNAFWIRPVNNFLEEVIINAKKVPRFKRIE